MGESARLRKWDTQFSLYLEVIPNIDYFKHLGGSYNVVKQGKERCSGGEARIDLTSLPI